MSAEDNVAKIFISGAGGVISGGTSLYFGGLALQGFELARRACSVGELFCSNPTLGEKLTLTGGGVFVGAMALAGAGVSIGCAVSILVNSLALCTEIRKG